MKTLFLEARNLTIRTPVSSLYSGLSFSIPRGEFFVLLGRNGTGKTTLLKTLTGDLESESGALRVFGRDLREWDLRELSRRRAVLPQTTTVNFGFRVIDIVLMGRTPHAPAANEKDIALRCLDQVGLSGFAERNLMTLSGGEQQRVHFARALAQLESPQAERLLFLDEPTSSLDIPHQHQCLRTARDLCGKGGSVFAILHDLNLAARYADQILVLEGDGRWTSGPTTEVMTSENLSRAFKHDIQVVPHPRGGSRPLVLS